GKTIQALAFINQLCEKPNARVLVVCPVAAISVWSEAMQEHCPHIRLQLWHGNRKKQSPSRSGVVLTSFALLHMDLDRFLADDYDAVFIDEAQNLRNSRSKSATAARLLRARSVFCLTGTPMENYLEDFRSIMDLAVPGLLGTSHSFRRTYTPSEPTSMATLARRASPFLLRRTKDLVLSELPEKTEINRVIPMQKKQAALYETLRQEALEELSIAGNEYLVQMLPHLMRLRRVACHPALGQKKANPLHSGKFQYLSELLDQFQKSESASLVFSQFTDALDIAESLLQSMQLKYVRLDGSTPQKIRSKNVAAFQSGQADVFLISLRAGGQAITLHRADRVVLLDPWWNPAVESQASDRAHRIGQKNPVFVYRLISEGSIEERVRELQSRKKELFHSLLNGISPEHSHPHLDRAELLELLAKSP
ncbi:MAG: DEAD/DEAH box helicase, partial [Leptospiraceae bacterium]|nr:DEAD/DEAH box helicase [Leptospiraceae bacterium]